MPAARAVNVVVRKRFIASLALAVRVSLRTSMSSNRSSTMCTNTPRPHFGRLQLHDNDCTAPRGNHHGRQPPVGAVEGSPHQRGISARRRCAPAHRRSSRTHGIEVLTVFAFSEENWSRPIDQTRGIMGLCRLAANGQVHDLVRDGVRVRLCGRLAALPLATREALERLCASTSTNSRITLNLAIDYGMLIPPPNAQLRSGRHDRPGVGLGDRARAGRQRLIEDLLEQPV